MGEEKFEMARKKRALMRGPGPIYALPPTFGYEGHDKTRHRNPAWTMGKRLETLKRKGVDNGPIGVPSHVTRFGAKRVQGKTFGERPRDLKTLETPAPNHYHPEQYAYPGSVRQPAWTLLGRPASFKEENTPGPRYLIPSTFGRDPAAPDKHAAPAFSMATRLDTKEKVRSPGPVHSVPPLSTTFKRPPAFSLGARVFPPGNRMNTAEFLSFEEVTKRRAPAFTFGTHHSELSSPMIVAGDNDYPLMRQPQKSEPCKPAPRRPGRAVVCPCPA